MSIKYHMFDEVITIKDSRIEYNNIRKVFEELAYELKSEFIYIYEDENSNLDDVSENAYQQGSDCIAKAISEAISILISKGIYDIDQQKFINKYYINYHIWDECFNSINDKYLEIVLNEEQLDEYRKVRRANRGRVIGGGFGIEGATKGIITAGALNLAAGAVHGIFNGVGKIISSISASMKKNDIFNDPNTLETLSDGVFISVLNVHYALSDVLINYSKLSQNSLISSESSEKAVSIFNNLRIKSFDKNTEISLLHQIIDLDPYDPIYYEYIIDKYGDRNGQIAKIAKFFGYENIISAFKDELLQNYFETLSTETELETVESKSKLIEKSQYLGINNTNQIEEFLNNIDEKLHDYDTMARTVNGITWDTREEATKVISQLSELDVLVKDYKSLNEKQLLDLKSSLENNYPSNVTSSYINKIDTRLKELDKRARTVGYVVLSSRDEIAAALEEVNTIESHISDIDTMDSDSLLRLHYSIRSKGLNIELSKRYVEEVYSKVKPLLEINEKNEIEKLYSDNDLTDEKKIYSIIQQIKDSHFETEVQNDYLINFEKILNELDIKERTVGDKVYETRLEARNEAYKQKLEKAKSHQQRLNNGTLKQAVMYVIGLIVSAGIVHYALNSSKNWIRICGISIVILGYIGYFVNRKEEKKAWVELTDNGSKSLPQ